VTGAGLTPSQTIGPFLAIGLPWPDGPFVVPEGTDGAIMISGRVLDGAGDPVPDALVESWQADPAGCFNHPDDPRGARQAPPGFRGFGRCPTDEAGRYLIITLRPGQVPLPGGRLEAPHLNVSVFARGLLDRVVTRIYFSDEAEANAADPVLAAIGDPERRDTLIAVAEPPSADAADSDAAGAQPRGGDAAGAQPRGGVRFRFDIRLQGDQETVFFDV
jgi:protocatechuate 3,4-dioxygenase, alpha subunit